MNDVFKKVKSIKLVPALRMYISQKDSRYNVYTSRDSNGVTSCIFDLVQINYTDNLVSRWLQVDTPLYYQLRDFSGLYPNVVEKDVLVTLFNHTTLQLIFNRESSLIPLNIFLSNFKYIPEDNCIDVNPTISKIGGLKLKSSEWDRHNALLQFVAATYRNTNAYVTGLDFTHWLPYISPEFLRELVK